MRVFGHCAVAGCLAAAVAFSGATALGTSGPAIGSAAQSKDPAAILAAARQALGGDKKLTAVKSFTATGRTRQVRGDNLVPIEFEIFVELPDKYLRKDEIPAQESGPTASGFNGEESCRIPAAGAAPTASGRRRRGRVRILAFSRPRGKRRATSVKQDFARLTLGMFAGSFAAYPLTFTYVGEAEAPQGKADVLDAKGPNNFTLRLFVISRTHLPIMVSWQRPAPPARPRRTGRVPACRRGAARGPAGCACGRSAAGAGAPPADSACSELLRRPPPAAAAPPAAPHRGARRRARRRRARHRQVRRRAAGARARRCRRSRTASTSPTTATSTACSSRSGSVAPSAPTRSKRPRSIGSGSTPKIDPKKFEVRKPQ